MQNCLGCLQYHDILKLSSLTTATWKFQHQTYPTTPDLDSTENIWKNNSIEIPVGSNYSEFPLHYVAFMYNLRRRMYFMYFIPQKHTSTALVFHYFNWEKGRFFFAVPKQFNMATNSADRKLSLWTHNASSYGGNERVNITNLRNNEINYQVELVLDGVSKHCKLQRINDIKVCSTAIISFTQFFSSPNVS